VQTAVDCTDAGGRISSQCLAFQVRFVNSDPAFAESTFRKRRIFGTPRSGWTDLPERRRAGGKPGKTKISAKSSDKFNRPAPKGIVLTTGKLVLLLTIVLVLVACAFGGGYFLGKSMSTAG
jgi:hypothetical protein